MARPDCQNQYGGPADLAVASCFSSERAKMIALKRAGEDEILFFHRRLPWAAPCNNVFYRWFNSPQNGCTIEAKRTVVDRYNFGPATKDALIYHNPET
ncbi:hypothetical protein Forpi1262_v008699 [Fusarium oxysporum f. sp. raphani]|uniref:Uncharacterized protein n=1 Tax=Fusarium oxysporum f. sp. raphani TaxID=96318 RepID=A0A8J5PNR1_FUSOX|nr:hypothetical protein Forpi1262_v008699 [Fusarium oxysporum f. sp. raphani]